MNLLVSGKLQMDEDQVVILYDELMEDHAEHVMMKLQDEMLMVNRTGEFSSQMCFCMGCRSEGRYRTPFGDIQLGVFCNRLAYDFNSMESKLQISFQLDMNGRFAAVHTIDMDILVQDEKLP